MVIVAKYIVIIRLLVNAAGYFEMAILMHDRLSHFFYQTNGFVRILKT